MTFRDPAKGRHLCLISQHQTPSDDGAVRSIIPPIGTIGRTSLAVEATKVFIRAILMIASVPVTPMLNTATTWPSSAMTLS